MHQILAPFLINSTIVINVIVYHYVLKCKMQNLHQDPPASSKAQNEDLKDMNVLCTFKIKLESQNLDDGVVKGQ